MNLRYYINKSLTEFVTIAEKYNLDSNITIVEVGARDCTETLLFNNLILNPIIYAFECNPDTLAICRKTVKNYNNIHLIEKAVSDIDGKIKFFQIDRNKTTTSWKDGNPGASSLFRASGKYPIEKYVQNETEVKSITLYTFMTSYNIKSIDMLWMDAQGAELLVLKGLKKNISNVKLIHLETEFFEIYKEQPLFKDIKKWLNTHGFLLYKFTSFGKYSADVIFINKNIIPKNLLGLIILYNKLSYHLMKGEYIIINILKRVINKINYITQHQ